MYINKIILILTAGIALSACQTSNSVNGFGNAVHQNLAVQIINPEPPVNAEIAPTDGEKLALALKRYKEGTVIPPRTLKLQSSNRTGNQN